LENDLKEKHQSRRGMLPRLSQFAVDHLLLLPLGALIAMVWANTAAESYFRLTSPMTFLVNDVAMVAFFGLIMKEVVEATAADGVLHPWRRAWLPIVASLGAAIVPALIYMSVVDRIGEPMLALGWPVTIATDLACGYFVARLIFHRHPAIPFFLLVAISANAIGFVMIALFDPMKDLNLGAGALLMAAALGLAASLRRARVKSFWPYVLGGGAVSWCALYWGGLHPGLALVPIMPFLPHAARDPGFFVEARPSARDALSRFEIWSRYPAQVALFFFGLVNAGISFGYIELGTIGVAVATVIGRPLGILAAVAIGVAAGLRLPQGVGWRELSVVGLATAIGFSVGLFFAAALFPGGQLRAETQMGVLLSLAGAPLAILAAKLLRVGRFTSRTSSRAASAALPIPALNESS
jgi:NhaA family Na+:H+ antiporter